MSTLAIPLPGAFTNQSSLRRYTPPLPVDNVLHFYTVRSVPGVDGTVVTAIPNLGSAGGSLVASGGPTIATASGKRYLHLDGINDWLQAEVSASGLGAAPFTVFSVVRANQVPSPVSSRYPIAGAGVGASGSVNVGAAADSSGQFRLSRGSTQAVAVTADTAWRTYMAVFDGAASLFRRDATETVLAGSPGTSAPGRIEIGQSTAHDDFIDLDLMAIGLIGDALTPAERTTVQQALASLHGL